MKHSRKFLIAIRILLVVPAPQAVALPVDADFFTLHQEKFEHSKDAILDRPHAGASSKFLFGLDRSVGENGRAFDSVKEVPGPVVTLQDAVNLRLAPWITQGSGGRPDANPVRSSRSALELIAAVVGSVKVQVGGGLQSDGTVFVLLRNIPTTDELLSVNAFSSSTRAVPIREGRLGIVRSLDANLLLLTTLMGGSGQVLSPANGGKAWKIVEQSLGYKFFMPESLQPNTFGDSVTSNLPGTSIDDRSGRGFAPGKSMIPKKRTDQNTSEKNDDATIFYLESSSVLVSRTSKFFITTTTYGRSDVYLVESHQSQALFLSRLKINSASTTGIITNSLAFQ